MARWGVGSGITALALAVLTVASCNPFLSCTSQVQAGIAVEVKDAATGVPAADGARGIVRDGAFVDSLFGTSTHMSGAYERPGVYEVIIAKEGYREWRTAGVEVTSGRCHVNTAQLLAMLERAE
jgi:hypothetical protein